MLPTKHAPRGWYNLLESRHGLAQISERGGSRATLLDGDSSAEEVREAVRALEDTLGVWRRVLGPQHPNTQRVQQNLEAYREAFPTTA